MPSGEKREETRHPSRSIKRIARTMMGVIGLFIVCLLVAWWRLVSDEAVVVTIPNPVMPNPNAFDFYVVAGNAVTFEDRMKPNVTYSSAQKEAFILPDVSAITTLHQGFDYPYLHPPCRDFNMIFPYYAKFRKLARLLALRGQVQAIKGDWQGATDSYLDAIRMGEDIPHGATLIGALVGMVCQSIGRKPMWNTIEHLNVSQSHTAINRLTSILERHYAFADTIQEEKWLGQSFRLQIFSDARTRAEVLLPIDCENASLYPAAQSLTGLLFLVESKSRIMHDFTLYMDQNAQLARQPYGLHLPGAPEPTGRINGVFLPISTQARWKDVECQTQNELLLVTLALHAFRLEHGHNPVSLAELMPAYLRKLPDDPYAVQGTFKYRIKGQSYVLYSVGPDGKDDGGQPIDQPKYSDATHPLSRYQVRFDSTGDVVAGFNYF